MKPAAFLLCAFVSLWLFACAPTGVTSQDVPLQTLRSETVTRFLASEPHRLGVVFWPQLAGCSACDLMISETLTEWQSESESQVVVVSVVPANAAKSPDTARLPGAVIPLSRDEYKRHSAIGPRPRVEIWSARGELLMVRSIPNYSSQSALLTEEMLAARALTDPVASVAKESSLPQ